VTVTLSTEQPCSLLLKAMQWSAGLEKAEEEEDAFSNISSLKCFKKLVFSSPAI